MTKVFLVRDPPTYHLERDSTALYLWRTGGPCVAILPADADRQEAETLAKLLLTAANGEEGEK